jgi:hypothetical protein
MKLAKSVIRIALIAVLLISILSLFNIFYITGSVQGDIIYDVTFEMKSDSDISLITVDNFTYSNAQKTRTEIDKTFGNENGKVEGSEIESYQDSFELKVQDLTITQNTYFDNRPLKISTTSVKILNGTGLTNSTSSIQIQYNSKLEPLIENPDSAWHRIVFLHQYYSNYTITIRVPEGWVIEQDPVNFNEFVRSENNRLLIGKINGTYDVKIKIYNPERMNEIDEDKGSDFSLDFLYDNLILILPLILAIIILIMFFYKGRKRDQELLDQEDQEEDDEIDHMKTGTEKNVTSSKEKLSSKNTKKTKKKIRKVEKD